MSSRACVASFLSGAFLCYLFTVNTRAFGRKDQVETTSVDKPADEPVTKGTDAAPKKSLAAPPTVPDLPAQVAKAVDPSKTPAFNVSLCWQKVEKVSLINPSATDASVTEQDVNASRGLLVFVSFAKDKAGGFMEKSDTAKKLTAVASLLHKGKLFKNPMTNKACTLANSVADGERRSLTVVPMSSLTCKLKNKYDVQYHDQLSQNHSKALYDELGELLVRGCGSNVDVVCGVFGCKQRLVVDSSEGPQMHQLSL